MSLWKTVKGIFGGHQPMSDARDSAAPLHHNAPPKPRLCESCYHFPPSRHGSPYLCDVCEPLKRQEFARCLEIADESIEIVRTSRNPLTKLSRLRVTMDKISQSADGYRWGLMTGHTTPEEEWKRIEGVAEDVAADYAAEVTEEARRKAASAATAKGRALAYERALEKLRKAKRDGPPLPILDDAIESLESERDQAR